MCDFGLGLAAISTALGAVGAVSSANARSQEATARAQESAAAAEAATYNSQVQRMNADISEKRARDALDRGALEEQRKRAEVARLEGKQRAALAANGLDLGFGSPLDTLVDTAMVGEVDALTIRRNAANEAYDFRVQAENERAGATLSTMKATSARKAEQAGYSTASSAAGSGLLSGFSTVLSGGSDIYKSGYSKGYWGGSSSSGRQNGFIY